MIKRLNSLGFSVNNEPFRNNSWYFRNALVRANYRNRDLGVFPDDSNLKLILRNAMFGEASVLQNRCMHIDWNKMDLGSTPQDTPQDELEYTPQDESAESRLIQVLAGKELSAVELMQQLCLSDRKNFRKRYLQPCLEKGIIEMTNPNKPTSKNQKYRCVSRIS